VGEHSGPSGARVGMWLFLCTEILLFGGLFLLYAVYRYQNPQDFHEASRELNRFHGTLNTAVLITSSLSVALAGHALGEGRQRQTLLLLGASLALGVGFLVVKGFEWGEKFAHGLYPSSPVLLARAKGEILYFGLYFMMTGLHALHVLIGLGVLTAVLVLARRGRVSSDHPVLLENAGLYWHLVDMIWIFLFPLFYLIGAKA
jgi:cytochrome c oxidase subunit 3